MFMAGSTLCIPQIPPPAEVLRRASFVRSSGGREQRSEEANPIRTERERLVSREIPPVGGNPISSDLALGRG